LTIWSFTQTKHIAIMLRNIFLCALVACATAIPNPIRITTRGGLASGVVIRGATVSGDRCGSGTYSPLTVSDGGEVGTLGFDQFNTESGRVNCSIDFAIMYTWSPAGSPPIELDVNVTTHGFADLAEGATGTFGYDVSSERSPDTKVRWW
jgi:hypothetical protein